MRKGILTVTILAASVAAHADDVDKSKETCDKVHRIAEQVMTDRQMGVAITDTIATVNNSFGEEMVIRAYKQNRWHTEARQKDAVEEFATGYYLYCVEMYAEK